MGARIQRWLPEIALAAVTLFFCFRELGTFPAPWVDESLFIQVARNVAAGRGYVLQVLHYNWPVPYILGVGPTLIVPSAFTLMLFGDSVAAARVATAGMTFLVSCLFYIYCRTISDRHRALWATALLVTLSAFINTGKPVLGEVPAFGFLLIGLLLLERTQTARGALLAGVFFGLSAITKVPYGIIFPALLFSFITEIIFQRREAARRLILIAFPAACLFLFWQLVEHVSRPGGLYEMIQYGFFYGNEGMFFIIRKDPQTLLRFPFVYFGILFLVFLAGIQRTKMSKHSGSRVFTITFVLFFILYFAHGPLWYRHLLPAHIMILPFVPVGIFSLVSRRVALCILTFFVAAQGWWQLDHRGSTPSGEAQGAAQHVLAAYNDVPMVISAPDAYVLLPEVPHRLFLSEEVLDRDFRMFPDLPIVQEEHCLPWLRKLGWEEQSALGERITVLYRRYVLIAPPESCNP